MLENDNFFNLTTDFFSLKGYKCEFNLREIVNLDNTIYKTLTVIPLKDKIINYAFSGNGGLCKTTPFGSIQEENILSMIMSLPNNTAKNTLQFFEEYGFLFPLMNSDETNINLADMVQILNRIKATVLLMTALESKNLDYKHILHLTLFLLLGDEAMIQYDEKRKYTTCKHSVFSIISSMSANYNPIDELDYITIDDEDYYQIESMVYPSHFDLRTDEYEDISSGETFSFDYPGIQDDLYKQITIAFKNNFNTTKSNRLLIEFLFHLMHDISVIKSVSFNDGIEFYQTIENFSLSDNLKKALLNVARITLSQEINYNVRNMKPLYNPGTLEPSWKANSLLTALYFSIFYIKPGSEIYRKCANPSCSGYFIVKTTNSRKKYCCDKCRNANNQRDYRKREQRN